MIENTKSPLMHDRLAAFLKVFPLTAVAVTDGADTCAAHLFILGDTGVPSAKEIFFVARGEVVLAAAQARLILAAQIDFGGEANPLVGTLPDKLFFSLEKKPLLRGIADLLVAEMATAHCGGMSVQNRLCEILVVMAVRQAISDGTIYAGLLAGLSHPTLYRALIAVHDRPTNAWRVDELAQIAEMSRTQFIVQFEKVVGQTPGAYLTSWRLALGRHKLTLGLSVKETAYAVGFGSASAFSRAFARFFGYSPTCVSSR
ncbi:MAG: helix-turn-helix domain-containing protein [Janthinobacterium lividum]